MMLIHMFVCRIRQYWNRIQLSVKLPRGSTLRDAKKKVGELLDIPEDNLVFVDCTQHRIWGVHDDNSDLSDKLRYSSQLRWCVSCSQYYHILFFQLSGLNWTIIHSSHEVEPIESGEKPSFVYLHNFSERERSYGGYLPIGFPSIVRGMRFCMGSRNTF